MIKYSNLKIAGSAIILSALTVVSKADEEHHDDDKYTNSQAWGIGFLLSFVVSALGFLLALGMVPVIRRMLKSKESAQTLTSLIQVLLALAASTLLADSMVHIIPESMGVAHAKEAESHRLLEEEAHEEKPNVKVTSAMVLISFFFFFYIDRLFKGCGAEHHHANVFESTQANNTAVKVPPAEIKQVDTQRDVNSKNQLVTETAEKLVADGTELDTENPKKDTKLDVAPSKPTTTTAIVAPVTETRSEILVVQQSDSKKGFFARMTEFKGKKSQGSMILFADFIHNIMDGLAIGAAFASKTKSTAISTFVAVLVHEIPQELGDMGVLIQSGFPIQQAVCCNGLMNFSALIGAIIGLAIGSINELAQAYILAFVAGNFIYIAGVELIPEVLKAKGKKTQICIFLAFALGIGLMYAISEIEPDEH